MKTKEIPRSLWRAWRLGRAAPERLGAHARPLPDPFLVSFTSIPSRLSVVHLTVRSLLDQTVRPELIVLWLEDGLQGSVPDPLQALADAVPERFQIRYRPGTSSHRKLVFALEEFPDHAVVVCDDDHMYPRDWLARLHQEYQANPGVITGHECRRIVMAAPGLAKPYADWVGEAPGASAPGTLAIGYGGVVYPPRALHPDATDDSRYLTLAPRADDLWFKAMARRAGTPVRRSSDPPAKPLPILRSQAEHLGSTNILEDGNRTQWEALVRAYPEIEP